MKRIKLIDTENNKFKQAWNLYERSFPLEERRTLAFQKIIIKHVNYSFEVILHGEEFIGIILWWGFSDLRFIECFATIENIRGKGFGKKILEDFKSIDNRPIILEVELPDEKIKERRIQFYKRLGFNLNNYFYKQPPLYKGGLSVDLLVMSYPTPILREEFDNFIKKYHPIIYNN